MATGTVIHVNPEGTGDYPAIQVAIAHAAEGDTILAAPGVYTSYFDKNLELRGKAITLMSAVGPESTVIDCQLDGRGFRIHEGEGPGTVIQGFTVTKGLATTGGAMQCEGTSPTVRDMVFSYCEATETTGGSGGGAVYCAGGGSPTFETVVFFGSLAEHGAALYAYTGSAPALSNCSVVGSSTENGGSLQCRDAVVTIENTIVAYEHPGLGIVCVDDGVVNVTHCLLFANLGGYEVCGDDIENITADPLFCDWKAEELEVCSDSPCLPTNNPYGVHIGARGESDCPCAEHVVIEVPYEYSTIGQALGVAGYGDTVLVHPGVYHEHNLNVGSGVALIGAAGRDSTVIDAQGAGPTVVIGYRRGAGRSSGRAVASDEVVASGNIARRSPDIMRIEGFTVTGATDSGIKLRFASPTIAGCTIDGNTAGIGGGMYCENASPVLTDVEFLDNEATSTASQCGGGGLYCRGASPALSGCAFWGNTGYRGGAVYCNDYSSPTITNCTISDNAGTLTCSGVFCRYSSPRIEHSVIAHGQMGSAVVCTGSSNPVVTQCVVFWNDNFDEMCGSAYANTYEPPLFCDHSAGDLTVCSESPCLPENNIYGVHIGALGIGQCTCPSGGTLTVPFEYSTIGGALAAAGFNDTVLVYPGIYQEHDLPLRWGTKLIGVAGPDSTVLDAQGSGTILNVGHPVGRGQRSMMTVEGFTLTGATDSAVRLGGTSLAIRDCVISGNSGASGGGVYAEYGGVLVEDCEFTGNTAFRDGGGLFALGSFVEVLDCTFAANSTAGYYGSDGGAVMGDTCTFSFSSTGFLDNAAAAGGGIYCANGDRVTIEDCTFVGNQALDSDPLSGGGGVHCHSEALALLSGSTFYMNGADRGGGVYARGQASATINGCTFVGNDAVYGASAFIRNAVMDLENTILAFGTGGGVLYCAEEGPVTTRYCDVYGNAGGDSLCGEHVLNLFVDPAFCDTTGGVFHLQECSPCVGAGLGGADIGAWGVSCPCGDPTGAEGEPVARLILLGCAPNPSRTGANIYYVVPPGRGPVELQIFDVSGRRVDWVVVEAAAGPGAISWDGRDARGVSVGSGVYFYELSFGGESRRGRMVLLR
jgi:hypothetical protein